MSSLLIATFPETKEIAKRVAKALKAEYTEIFVEDFPDGEFHLMLKKNPQKKKVVIINSLAKDPDEKLIETMLAGATAKDFKAKKVILIATYFPYLRQDKHFVKYDALSSRYIMKAFEHFFDKIIVIDPHLHRIKNLQQISHKAESITINDLIAEYIKKRFKKDFAIIGPDEESAQWAQKIANNLGKKVVVMQKTRFTAQHIKIKEQPLKYLGKNIILIDDIISTGKTLAAALKMAKQQGAKHLVCIGIHGLLIGDAAKLINKYAELITTNTIPNKYAKIDISPEITQALRRYG
jgi:ribose-phosphate pyrophosphokinase